MRSIRKLPELCLFLYFGTNHYTACGVCLVLVVCLTVPDQGCTGRIWSPRTSCTLTRRAGGCPLQVLVYHLDITKACIAGWTCQPGSRTTAGTPPSALPPLTHRGTKCWRISGIGWGVCFIAEATQGVPKKFPIDFRSSLDRLALGRTIIFIIQQGCTNCGSLAAWQPGCEIMEREWENEEEMEREWGKKERLRKWREINSLHFLIIFS